MWSINTIHMAGWTMRFPASLGAGLAHSILLQSGRRFDFSG
jgi:hypothetical protein